MKAQSSLEMLSTYGWLIIMIAILVGAVMYFGLTNPTLLLSEECKAGPDFTCNDFAILVNETNGAGLLIVDVHNGLGTTLSNASQVSCTFPNGNTTYWKFNESVRPGRSFVFRCQELNGGDLIASSKQAVDFRILYAKETSLVPIPHAAVGRAFAKVETTV